MNKIHCLTIALFVLGSFAFAASNLIGQPAPVFKGTTVSGEPFDLAEHLGKKPIILLFWNILYPLWDIEAAYWTEARRKYRDQLLIVGINTLNSPEDTKEFMAKRRWFFPVLLDKNHSLASTYRIFFNPTAVYIGIDGTIIGYHAGYYKSHDYFISDIERVISWRP